MIGTPVGVSQGSTNSFLVGSKKRRLPLVTLANFSPVAAGVTAVTTFDLTLKGLNTDLVALVSAGIIPQPGTVNTTLGMLFPTQYPATPGTIQLFPVHGVEQNGGRIALREVFQDPTATDNADHPLAQNLPFGWSFEPEGTDDVIVRVRIDPTQYGAGGTVQYGRLVVAVTIEYVGESINISGADKAAIEFALGQVNLTQVAPIVIQTA